MFLWHIWGVFASILVPLVPVFLKIIEFRSSSLPYLRSFSFALAHNHGSKWVAPFDSGGIFVSSGKFLKFTELIFLNFYWTYKNPTSIRWGNLFISLRTIQPEVQ